MPTLAIDDFRHGLDLRKSPLTAVGGSLQQFTNAVLTQGGEIEKRKAFVQMGTLPSFAAGLFGYGGQLHTWGSTIRGADPILSSGLSLAYHNVDAPIEQVIDVEVYAGTFWVGGMSGGSLRNWYNGVTTGTHSSYSRIYQDKLYRTEGSLLAFSSVGAPGVELNTPARPGGGFVDVTTHDSEGEGLSGLEVYYGKLAVFSRHSTQIWAVDPDPALNQLNQVIRVGSVAPHAIRQFGTGDVLFLSDSGVRSLRALNQSLAAGVIDVGSPIDKLVTADLAADPDSAFWARSVVEPITGRFWLAIGGHIYVLSFFPSAKISAWSRFDIPFRVDAFAVLGNSLYVLGNDRNIYLYGGTSGNTYDNCRVTVRTPHMGADKPNVVKKVQSLSAVAWGQWRVSMGLLSDNTDLFETIATLTGPSTTSHRIPARGHGTHIGLELVHEAAGPATLASVAINHELNEHL